MKLILEKILSGKPLSQKEAAQVMGNIVDSVYRPEVIGAILGALNTRTISSDELAGFVTCIKRRANRLEHSLPDVVDVCGTGGDNSNTFNVSTTVALVLSACSVTVAKHGNRAISSRCGSADLLDRLGVDTTLDSNQAKEALEELDFAFLFAPRFHPVMASVGPIRQSLGVKTVFNLIGPLINPAGAKRQLLGVYDQLLVEPMAETLLKLGCEEAMVVCGDGGLDEIAISGSTTVAHLKEGEIRCQRLSPEDVGLQVHDLSSVQGGDAARNAKITLSILNGDPSAYLDMTLINTAAALVVAGRCPHISDGLHMAREAIASGRAIRKLQQLQQTHSRRGERYVASQL